MLQQPSSTARIGANRAEFESFGICGIAFFEVGRELGFG
jgi:hypothetical protein